MIDVRRVTCSYGGTPVLSDFSLEIQTGETLSLVGPNSAGKSTLLKAMGGILLPISGEIRLNQRPLSSWTLPERARLAAWVPSEADFTFAYTVEEIVMLGRTPYLRGDAAPRVHDRHVVSAMLALTDLPYLATRSVDALSSGERQRVLLARALAQEPSVLFMDEPTAHLDIGHAQAFFRALRRLREDRQLTVVLATHDLSLARQFSSRVALLQCGRLHALGAPSDVLTDANIQTVFELLPEA